MLPLDPVAGYALPGALLPEGIIPSLQALIPSELALDRQKAAVELWHAEETPLTTKMNDVSTQILFVR